MSMLEAALTYAEMGWQVFPCRPKTKKPATEHGYLDATTDPAKIKKWWTQNPYANIGIAAGARSGIVVVDIDVDEADGLNGQEALEALIGEHGPLPETLVQKTPRGGQHIIFAHPGQKVKSRNGKLGKGIDVKADGGYLMAAPSVHPNGKIYRWTGDDAPSPRAIADAPSWLMNLLVEHDAPKAPRCGRRNPSIMRADVSGLTVSHYARAAFENEIQAVLNTTKGSRNEALNKASFALGQFVGAGALIEGDVRAQLMAAATAIGLPPSESEKTIESGLKAGIEKPRSLPEPNAGNGGGKFTEPPKFGSDGKDSEKPVFDFTDDGIAKFLIDHLVGKVAYIASRKNWMVWGGKRWLEDETLQVQELARIFCRKIGAHAYSARLARSVRSASRVNAVLTLARGDRRIAAGTDQWDKDDWKLNTPAGIVDLKSGIMSDHDPLGFHTKITRAAPGGIPHTWLQFLHDVLDGNAEHISFTKRFAGYALSGSTKEHKFVFLHGPGGNGKSTFIDTLLHVIGDYGINAPMQTFTASSFDRHPTELAMLDGARLVTAQETEQGSFWAEARLKQLTGGDPVTARRMRKEFETFIPKCKLFFSGNNTPSLKSPDDAMRRRMIIVPFPNSIPQHKMDPDLPRKLKKEAGSILQWMIEGCLEYVEKGLAIPRSITAHTLEYLEDEDTFGRWIEEECYVADDQRESSSVLHGAYTIWMKNNGEKALSMTGFVKTLKDRGFKQFRSARCNGFEGMRLHQPKDDQTSGEVGENWEC